MRHLIMFAIGVIALMISIYVFAPQSENKVIRAIVVIIAMRIGVVAALAIGGETMHPAIGLFAASLVPLVVLKLWYGTSLWRSWVIMLFVGLVTFGLDGVVLKLEDRMMSRPIAQQPTDV